MLRVSVVCVLLPTLAFCWSGILVPAESGDDDAKDVKYPGQIYAPMPMSTVGLSRLNFGVDADSRDVSVTTCGGDKVYVTGGRKAPHDTPSREIIVYDAGSDTSTSSGMWQMTQPRWAHFSVCLRDNAIYGKDVLLICGGGHPSRTSSCEICSPHDQKCWPAASMPAAASNQRAVSFLGDAYVLGGYNLQGAKAFWVYNSKYDNWTTLASSPTPRAEFGFVHFMGKMFACGGWDGAWLEKHEMLLKSDKNNYKMAGAKPSATCDWYDPIENKWMAGPMLTKPRMRLGMVELWGRVFAVAGIYNSTAGDVIEEFEYLNNKWRTHDTHLMQGVWYGVTSVGVTVCS